MRTFVIVIISLIMMSACSNENKYGATITFSEPITMDNHFLFTTCGGQMIIMVDSKAAVTMNKLMLEAKDFSLYELGVGNAFAVDSCGKYYLYTARHCTKGLEKIERNIGNDISIVNYSGLKAISPSVITLAHGYEIEYNVNNYDSVFIKGYLSDKKGKVSLINIKGIGKLSDGEIYKVLNKEMEQFLQKRYLHVLMKKNVDLAGLSGAPAFNKQGKVIGVYSGRSMSEETGNYYLRISLFNDK